MGGENVQTHSNRLQDALQENEWLKDLIHSHTHEWGHRYDRNERPCQECDDLKDELAKREK